MQLQPEVQAKVRAYVSQKMPANEESSHAEVRSITVPISTFPPTAMVYNVTKTNVDKHDGDVNDESKPPIDVVSASIMAKVLEEREKERTTRNHSGMCMCSKSILRVDSETQTLDDVQLEDHNVQNSERPSKVLDYTNGHDKSHRHSGQHKHKYEKPSDPTMMKTHIIDISENQSSMRRCTSSKNLVKIQIDPEEASDDWYKLDGKSSKDLKNLESSRASWQDKEDIINKRLWKNNWNPSQNQQHKDLEYTCTEMNKIEGINDRVWKMNR